MGFCHKKKHKKKKDLGYRPISSNSIGKNPLIPIEVADKD